MMNLRSSASSLSEKFDEVAPLQCFHDSQSGNALTVVSLEIEEDTASICPKVQRLRHPDDLRKLSGLRSRPTGADFVSRTIFLTQNNSFRPLNVTEEVLRLLIEEHDINPQFLDTASSFCSKTSNVEDSLCLPFWMRPSQKYLEYMYIFKYPEQSDRAKRPWYLRQTALYHQLRRSDNRSTYVLISPYPDTTGQQAVMAWILGQKAQPVFGIHDLLFNCYLPKHRTFATAFEEKIENLSMKMRTVGLRDIESVTPQDMASLNHIHGKLLPQQHALLGFQRMLFGLDRAIRRWSTLESCAGEDIVDQWEDLLAGRRSEIDSYKTNSDALVQKCELASQLLTSILEFNNRSISDQQRKIASQQNARVSLLTQFTVNDSITVRTVTAISLVFLCAATIASILETPIFYGDPNDHKIYISPSAWIYPVVCVPLTGLTLGYWRWSLWRKKRQRQELMSGMGVSFGKLDDGHIV